MKLQEKIDSIDFSKVGDAQKLKNFISNIEKKSKESMIEAQALMDGLLVKIKEKYPDAVAQAISPQKAKRTLTKLKEMQRIVPRKADYVKIADQIQNEQKYLTRPQAEELAKLRIEAQISRAISFNDMLDTLSSSSFYTGRLSTAQIDKGRERDLQKDAKRSSLTESDERKRTGRKFKRVSKAGHKNQFGTTKSGNIYYEYRDNRRDVDKRRRLGKGGKVTEYEIDAFVYEYQTSREEAKQTLQRRKARLTDKENERLSYLARLVKTNSQTDSQDKEFDKLVHKYRGWEYSNGGGVEIPNADKMFHLPFELAVYVPSTTNVSDSISATEMRKRVKETETYLAQTFGGFTSSEKIGGYLSSKSSIVTEKVVPVTAFTTKDDFEKNKSKLVSKMSVWAKAWGQEAIGFEFEGDLYYVPQKFKEGGRLKATYIPRRNIKTLTTTYGNTIKGKDLIDGAYTTRKNIRKDPKMIRTIFEEEYFEDFGKGGRVSEDVYYDMLGAVPPLFISELDGVKQSGNTTFAVGEAYDYMDTPNGYKSVYQAYSQKGKFYYNEGLVYFTERGVAKSINENYKNGGNISYPNLSLEKPDVVNDSIALTEFELKQRKEMISIPNLHKNKITDVDTAVTILRNLWEGDTINANEQCYVLFLNKNNTPIGYYHHSSGGIDGTIMDVQMISGMAIKSLSKGVIVAHNHPSGNTQPSDADKKISIQLFKALELFNIHLVDSIILTENDYRSLANDGLF